jgi:murein L,D-transpeptidase YcbB/YkuD
MPREPQSNRIVANIPEFKLHVFEDSGKVFDIDIVVGTAANKTVIFNDLLKYVVFSPYWNIPRSIVRKEILPAMQRDRRYLARMNMEKTGFSNGLPVIRQKPGKANALGKVKFIFPNSYNIYFHDTPSKSLFERKKRAFSHGCIRLAEPRKLAEYLLRNQPQWTTDTIGRLMNSTKETWVTLNEPIPVVITYFTAWVSNDGMLNFRDDIYGHDRKLAERLFTQ